VFQSLDALPPGSTVPPGREKPWGTGHAVWCAREAVRGPFAVIGADDFFGADAFQQLAAFFRRPPSATKLPTYAMVGYRLLNTLSAHGAVARGVCTAGVDGRLQRVVEQTGIQRSDVGNGRRFTGDETVSMNCWAFTPAFFPELDRQWRAFFSDRGLDLKAEFFLPEAVSEQVATGRAVVHLLPTEAEWFGVTYRDDKPRVQSALERLTARGDYPVPLFPS
jgi:hypothetical protein